MLGSPVSGACTTPPLAIFTYRRLSAPVAQRTPSPKRKPFGSLRLPCTKIVGAFARSPELTSTSESEAGSPNPSSRAPPVSSELSQPRPSAPVLAQGQGVGVLPSPKQPAVPVGSHSSSTPFPFQSWLVPLARSQPSCVPFRLQSVIVPAPILKTSPPRSQMYNSPAASSPSDVIELIARPPPG